MISNDSSSLEKKFQSQLMIHDNPGTGGSNRDGRFTDFSYYKFSIGEDRIFRKAGCKRRELKTYQPKKEIHAKIILLIFDVSSINLFISWPLF